MQMNGLFDDPVFSCQLKHMDRICFGLRSIFLFRYPLLNVRKQEIMDQITQAAPNLDPEIIEARIEA